MIQIFSAISLFICVSLSFHSCNPQENKKNLFINTNTGLESLTPKPGQIIFVTGSCSSGKTSMAKIIAQKLNAKSFTYDDYVMPVVLKKFITKHYGKFLAFFISGLVMRNFFSFIDFLSDKRKYAFQKKFYKDIKEGLADEPTIHMYQEVKKAAQQGHDVVVESPIYLWGGIDFLQCLEEFKGTNITYVLAYCPWNDLIDRIKKRNSSSNKKNRRELDWVLGNYVPYFEFSPDNHGKHPLEYVSGTNVHSIITEYAQPHYKKKHLRLLPETQQAVLQACPKDTIYHIYPHFAYDLTINTTVNTPEQGATFVVDYIQKKCS